MPTLDAQIAANKRRTKLLFGVFFLIYALPVALVVAAAGGWPAGDDPRPLLICLAILVIALGIAVWRAERLVLRLTNAKPIHSRLECPRLWDMIAKTSIAGGVPMPKVYLVADDQPNAFAAGRKPETTLIGATTTLLEVMDDSELEAIMAHEVAHLANGDAKLMTNASALVYGITLIAGILSVIILIVGVIAEVGASSSSDDRNQSDSGGGLAAALVAIAFIQTFVIVSNLVHLAISRRREYIADATAVIFTRYPEGMISALTKFLDTSERNAAAAAQESNGFFGAMFQQVFMLHRAAVAHLYISSLLPSTGWITNLFSTHPPLEKRIAKLEPLTNGQIHRNPMPPLSPAFEIQ